MPVPESIFRAELTPFDLEVDGRWPDGLDGEMFISAPVVDERLSYQLFGFGAMVRISLRPGTHGAPEDRHALRHAVIDTPVKRLHDRLPDRFVGGLLGLESPFGHANMVNTAPLAWNGRLFATWDVGRPAEVDPVSLRFLGEVGSASSWGGDSFGGRKVLPQVFSTAHPVVDPQRNCLWTVKLVLTADGMSPVVVRHDGDGAHVRTWPLPGAVVVGSMHTIAQTENWLVLADSGNFKADMGEIMGGERSVTVDSTVPVYFVRKDDLESTPSGQPVRWERGMFGPTTGHYYASWDDSDGITVLFEHMDLTDLGYRLLPDDVDAHGRPINPAHVGFYQMAMSAQTVSEVRFRPGPGRSSGSATGEVLARTREDWAWNLQLSAMDWSLAGSRAPTHHHVVFQGRRPQMTARRVLDVYGGRVSADVTGPEQRASLATFRRGGLGLASRWEFPSEGDFPSSPIFVPRPGGVPGGGDGWVVVPVLSDDGFRLDCFDAADTGGGPVASLRAPDRATMPFLLHAVWMESAAPAPSVERLSFVDDIDEGSLSRLDDEARDAVLAVAADLAVV
jgi:hypothetical protein